MLATSTSTLRLVIFPLCANKALPDAMCACGLGVPVPVAVPANASVKEDEKEPIGLPKPVMMRVTKANPSDGTKLPNRASSESTEQTCTFSLMSFILVGWLKSFGIVVGICVHFGLWLWLWRVDDALLFLHILILGWLNLVCWLVLK